MPNKNEVNTPTDDLIDNAQWQQRLIIAQQLAESVLNEAGDMGVTGTGNLSTAIAILSNCVNHFSMEQGDIESRLNR